MCRARHELGFSLVELGVVLILIGIVLGIAVPAVRYSTQSSALRAGADGLSAQIQLARQKAVDTQATLILRFAQDSLGSDFHVRDASGAVTGKWSLPPDILYANGSVKGITFSSDGRASPAAYVVLQDPRARRDTLSVQASGMVLHQ